MPNQSDDKQTRIGEGITLASPGVLARGERFITAVTAIVVGRHFGLGIVEGKLEHDGVAVAFRVSKNDRNQNARVIELELLNEGDSEN